MKQTRKQLHEDITQTTTLKELITGYEEVAALKMKRIREQVLQSRDFHHTLSHYFHEIKAARASETQLSQTVPPQEKHLAILLSDDKGLYGDILHETKETFINAVSNKPEYELAIVGTLPVESLKAALPGREMHIFPYSSETKDLSSLHDLLLLLGSFTAVTVFHGTFISLITQKVASTHLTGEEELSPEQPVVIRQYLLEPSATELREFFQKEILSLLFEQTLLEGTLSKEASRMVSLEKATDATTKRINKLKRLARLAEAQHKNKEQLTYLAGLSLWKIQ